MYVFFFWLLIYFFSYLFSYLFLQVDVELEAKRNEFRERMEACAQRQVEVQKKQQRVRV
jgi:hypothetical protein